MIDTVGCNERKLPASLQVTALNLRLGECLGARRQASTIAVWSAEMISSDDPGVSRLVCPVGQFIARRKPVQKTCKGTPRDMALVLKVERERTIG